MNGRTMFTFACAAFAILSFHGANALGPIALVLLSPKFGITGLVTGTVGSVLGAIALGAQVGGLKAAADAKKAMNMHMPHMGYGKRSVDEMSQKIYEEKRELEDYIDSIYTSDKTQCVEKLVCDVTRREANGAGLEIGESLIRLIESNTNHGFTYKRMVVAEKVGIAGGDCGELFDSCPLETDQMIEFMAEVTRQYTLQE